MDIQAKSEGLERRTRRRHPVPVDASFVADIQARLEAGETAAAIAEALQCGNRLMKAFERLDAAGWGCVVLPRGGLRVARGWFFTPREMAQIKARFDAGESVTRIMETLEAPRYAVMKVLARTNAGVAARPRTGRPRAQKAFFTPDEIAEIRSRFAAGERARDIARSLGCSRMRISKALGRRGQIGNSRKVPSALAEQITALITEEGMSVAEASGAFGVSVCTVYRTLERSGIAKRRAWRAGRARKLGSVGRADGSG